MAIVEKGQNSMVRLPDQCPMRTARRLEGILQSIRPIRGSNRRAASGIGTRCNGQFGIETFRTGKMETGLIALHQS